MSTETVKNPNSEVDAWAAKVAKLRGRKTLERPVVFHDDDTSEAAEQARVVAGHVEAAARKVAQVALDIKNPIDPLVVAAVDEDPNVIEARAGVAAAEKAQADASTSLRVRGLGSDLYEELQGEHPPTDKQAKNGEEYNVKTFAPALVSACCTDPLTVEFAAELLGTILNQGEAAVLFNTCIGVNQGARVSLGKG